MEEQRNIAQEIKESLAETLDFVKGKPTKGRVVYLLHGDEICPRDIRKKTVGVNRQVFYDYFHLSVHSQRNWELGLRTPPEHTLSYYKLIKTDPVAIYKMLHGTDMPV